MEPKTIGMLNPLSDPLSGHEVIELEKEGVSYSYQLGDIPGTKAHFNMHYELLRTRDNHIGLQPMESIEGLAQALDNKVSVDSVYVTPSDSKYSVVDRTTIANEVTVIPFANKQNTFGFHGYALKSTGLASSIVIEDPYDSYVGYFVHRPLWYSQLSVNPEKHRLVFKPMTGYSGNDQTVTHSSIYATIYPSWVPFRGTPVTANTQDCWASADGTYPIGNEFISIILPVAVTVAEYELVNRGGTTSVSAPIEWVIEGRLNLNDEWSVLDTRERDPAKANVQMLSETYTIPIENRMLCRELRIRMLRAPLTFCCIGRLNFYREENKAIVKLNEQHYKPNVTSSAMAPVYLPMTTEVEQGQTILASSFYSATYAPHKAFLAGYSNIATEGWISANGGMPTTQNPQWLELHLPESKQVKIYQIQNYVDPRAGYSCAPSSWIVQARNSVNDPWVDLHTVSDNPDVRPGAIRTHFIPDDKVGSYSQYRLYITARTGAYAYVVVARFKLFDFTGEYLTPLTGPVDLDYIKTNGVSDEFHIPKLPNIDTVEILTSEGGYLETVLDNEKEYTLDKTVDVTLTESSIRFKTPTAGNYKFCYQEPN